MSVQPLIIKPGVVSTPNRFRWPQALNNNNNNNNNFPYLSACQQQVAYNRRALKVYVTKTRLRQK
jgi:hypothetical protein